MDSLLNGVFSLKKCGLGKRREICNMMKGFKKKKRGGTFSPLGGIALVALLSQSRTAKSRSWAFKQKPGDCVFDICQIDSILYFSCRWRLFWSLNSTDDSN